MKQSFSIPNQGFSESNPSAFGYQILLDGYECNPIYLDDINYCYNFLNTLVDLLEMEKQAPPYVIRTPVKYVGKEGLSAWVPLIESGISLHTIELKSFISLDVYSCKIFKPDNIINYVKKTFEFIDFDIKYILRGVKY